MARSRTPGTNSSPAGTQAFFSSPSSTREQLLVACQGCCHACHKLHGSGELTKHLLKLGLGSHKPALPGQAAVSTKLCPAGAPLVGSFLILAQALWHQVPLTPALWDFVGSVELPLVWTATPRLAPAPAACLWEQHGAAAVSDTAGPGAERVREHQCVKNTMRNKTGVKLPAKPEIVLDCIYGI